MGIGAGGPATGTGAPLSGPLTMMLMFVLADFLSALSSFMGFMPEPESPAAASPSSRDGLTAPPVA